jgi:hypothetical protein
MLCVVYLAVGMAAVIRFPLAKTDDLGNDVRDLQREKHVRAYARNIVLPIETDKREAVRRSIEFNHELLCIDSDDSPKGTAPIGSVTHPLSPERLDQ